MTHASLYTDGKLSKGRIGTAKNIGATSGPKHGSGGVSAARGARGQNRAKTGQPTATPAQWLGKKKKGLLPRIAPQKKSCPNSPHFKIYTHIRGMTFGITHVRPPPPGLTPDSACSLVQPYVRDNLPAIDPCPPHIWRNGLKSLHSRGHTQNPSTWALAYPNSVHKKIQSHNRFYPRCTVKQSEDSPTQDHHSTGV